MPPSSAAIAAPDPVAALTGDSEPEFQRIRGDDGREWIQLSGPWNLRSIESRWTALKGRLAHLPRSAGWDLTRVSTLDHAGALLLWHAWGRRMPEPVEMRPEQDFL